MDNHSPKFSNSAKSSLIPNKKKFKKIMTAVFPGSTFAWNTFAQQSITPYSQSSYLLLPMC